MAGPTPRRDENMPRRMGTATGSSMGQRSSRRRAHRGLVLAVVRTDSFEQRRSYGITMFLVPTDVEGLTIKPIPIMGSRSTGVNHVYHDDVKVPKEYILGELNKGLYSLFNVLNDSSASARRRCVWAPHRRRSREALKYAKTREAFRRPIGQFQAVQHRLAECWTKIRPSGTSSTARRGCRRTRYPPRWSRPPRNCWPRRLWSGSSTNAWISSAVTR